MTKDTRFVNANVVLPDRILSDASVQVQKGLIHQIDSTSNLSVTEDPTEVIDVEGDYLCPGFIDIHVHGGGGADFMDGNRKAFEKALRTHGTHGTTSLVCTSTVAQPEQIRIFLSLSLIHI